MKLRLYVGQMKEKVSKFTYPMFPHYFIILHITNTHSMRKIINQRGITCEKPSHQNFRQICTSTLLSLTTTTTTKNKVQNCLYSQKNHRIKISCWYAILISFNFYQTPLHPRIHASKVSYKFYSGV